MVNNVFIRGDGQGRVNYEIARHAVNTGHDVTLVASRVDPDLADGCRWKKIDIGPLKSQLVRNRAFALLAARAVERQRHDADIVLTNGANTLVPADVNIAHFVHGSWLRSPVHTAKVTSGWYSAYSNLFSRVSAYEERIAFTRARSVIAISTLVSAQLASIDVDSKKISVIYNGVDTSEFVPTNPNRASCGLPTDKPIGFFAGDMATPRKNLDSILHALRELPDVHLIVVGPLHRNPYPAMAASLGLSDRVHFLGFRKDIATLYGLADFFVFPSRYEPFGLVILEALAAGLPVITSRSAGGSEIIDDSCGYILDESDDRLALGAAIKRLSTDEDLRRRQSAGARAVAEAHTWEAMSSAYVDHFIAIQCSS